MFDTFVDFYWCLVFFVSGVPAGSGGAAAPVTWRGSHAQLCFRSCSGREERTAVTGTRQHCVTIRYSRSVSDQYNYVNFRICIVWFVFYATSLCTVLLEKRSLKIPKGSSYYGSRSGAKYFVNRCNYFFNRQYCQFDVIIAYSSLKHLACTCLLA